MKNAIFRYIFIIIIYFIGQQNLVAQSNAAKVDSSAFAVKDNKDSAKISFLSKLSKTKNGKPTVLSNAYWKNRPRTATILSLALPGAGQVYNGHWWKVPIVYGLIGGMGYLYKSNIDDYLKFRAESVYRSRNQNQLRNPSLAVLNDDAIGLYRDQYLSNAEQAGFGLLLAYLLNAGDAFVDAHLQEFNISDDLSVRLKPSLQTSPNNAPTMGIGVAFTFK
jgi:Family of unknown function (DUF5683)